MGADQAPVVEPRGTFVFERKVNDGDYGSTLAMASVQFPIDWGNDVATAQAAKDAAFQAKMTVFEQLGIKAEYDSEAGVLREVIEKTFGAVTKVTAPADTAASTPRQQASDGVTCPECNGPMYDNRTSKTNARQPDYRCKNYKPENGGCKGVVWPPKGGN